MGRTENVIGWYHSHPGYGCWLSGIDVNTQRINQQGMDPFLAIVVDPVRTCSAGKVELGAFRCYPDHYRPADAPASEYQTIPLDKIEDFGVHAGAYYPLAVSYFKSALDRRLLALLWNKYWVNTLSSSPLLAVRRALSFTFWPGSARLTFFTFRGWWRAERGIHGGAGGGPGQQAGGRGAERRSWPLRDGLAWQAQGGRPRVVRHGRVRAQTRTWARASGPVFIRGGGGARRCKVTVETLQGLMTHLIKHRAFNGAAA